MSSLSGGRATTQALKVVASIPGIDDGKALTAEDVAWNLSKLADPKGGSPLQSIFASMKNIKAQGDTVTFTNDGGDVNWSYSHAVNGEIGRMRSVISAIENAICR